MKKPLLIFIILVVLLLLGKFAYEKYCTSKPHGCKKVKIDEPMNSTQEGIDW